MLQEAKDLQRQAVDALVARLSGGREVLTFRAPTGSGKTRMMGDMMERVLAERDDMVWLVSSLSKGGLAEQNYRVLRDGADGGVWPHIDPWLISSDVADEERLHIPTGHNVYVLPRDLNRQGGRLMQGALTGFLDEVTSNIFGCGLNKRIYVVKDECHQATNNLDALHHYFDRVINMSATPSLKRGQVPDVEITDEAAVGARLIKRIELCEDPDVPVDAAIEKLMEVKRDYARMLGVNPCLIIQISNKDKAQEEWTRRVRPAIERYQQLKWMYIVDKDKDCDTNDDVRGKLPVSRWKDYARQPGSTIDIIVFKMVITEGWDIPRACMLYQVRDTQSRQLDEQVVGRVRRNPRLSDFETLTAEAQQLAMTAWVWGVRPDALPHTRQVRLWQPQGIDVRHHILVTTTRLSNPSRTDGFDVDAEVERKPMPTVPTSIFELHRRLMRCPDEVQRMCYDYAGGDVGRWWHFAERVGDVARRYDAYNEDYDHSMEVAGEVSFPVLSQYVESNQTERIPTWVWCRRDGSGARFAFDSEAEREWAGILKSCEDRMATVSDTGLFDADTATRRLWGKNFPAASDIKYEYYSDGIHTSYPDFVMKDKRGRIHVFEVKSVVEARESRVDKEQYEAKIDKLRRCYRACSAKVPGHLFYIPVLKDDWTIYKYEDGVERTISEDEFVRELE